MADRLTDCGRQVLERVLLGLFQPPAPVLLGLVGQWHREVLGCVWGRIIGAASLWCYPTASAVPSRL